jgi:hypothetical protein
MIRCGATSLLMMALSLRAQTTWDGGGNGVNWLDAANWAGDDAPDTAGENVLIDGGVAVTLDPPLNTIRDIGSLTVDAGNTLNLRYDLTLNTNSGRNRISVIMTLDAQNQNDGAISANITANADRDNVRLRLENSGTFTNNGSILIQNTEPATSSYVQLQLLTASSAVTFDGTGSVTLDLGAGTDTARARIDGNGAAGTLTNGNSHTIDGEGLVGGNSLNVVNNGLLHATGDTGALDMDTASFLTNNVGGRMVASGAGGMNIGSASETFLNNGLMESRSGSSINFLTSYATHNGSLAGDGGFTATTLSLTGAATLNPGDLSNSDGTGTSTVGDMSITGDLVLADTTILNVQLGDDSAAGTSFDAISISGGLTLDGILNISDLAGFSVGTYRIMTFSGGSLTDNGLDLGSTPGAYTYSLDADNAGGFVDLTVIPEPSTWALVTGAFAMVYLLRRRRG